MFCDEREKANRYSDDMDDHQQINLESSIPCNGGVNHVLNLCDGLSLSQLDVLQDQIRDRRNARAGFLRLPGEIRNRVYELVIESEIIRPARCSYMDLTSVRKLLVGVSGFNMCKQIRTEFRSFLQPEQIQICKYEDPSAAFLPVELDVFGKSMRGAKWFRAIGCDSLAVAQKSVKLCEDEMSVDYCGTITFGAGLGLRPMFFAVDLVRTDYNTSS